MSEPTAGGCDFSKLVGGSTPLNGDLESVDWSAVRAPAFDEAKGEIARQLNGPLTALLLYMDEIKHQIQQPSQTERSRIFVQQIVENALQQTERIRAIVRQLADTHNKSIDASGGRAGSKRRVGRTEDICLPWVMRSSAVGQQHLTKRESEVLCLVSEGYTNKHGALRMGISPRTFESHRARMMRKLAARNTADLVRLMLGKPRDVLPNEPGPCSTATPAG